MINIATNQGRLQYAKDLYSRFESRDIAIQCIDEILKWINSGSNKSDLQKVQSILSDDKLMNEYIEIKRLVKEVLEDDILLKQR